MNNRSVTVFHDAYSVCSSQYGNILQGIRAAAVKNATQVRTVTDEDFDRVDWQELPRVCIAMGSDMPFLRKVIDKLDSVGRHALLAGCDAEPFFGHTVSCVTPSRRTEMQRMISYLYGCGRSRLALVGFGRNSINDTVRYRAAVAAVAARGDVLREEDVYRWNSSPEESFQAFLQRAAEYDAVVCPNDIIAVFVINRLKREGISVPEDLYAASFGNFSVGLYHTPSITSTVSVMTSVGEQALAGWRFLMSNDKNVETALRISVPSRLIIRESTANTPEDGAVQDFHAPSLEQDPFYTNDSIAELVRIEKCLSACDPVSLGILRELLDGKSYEQAGDDLYIGASTLRYRMSRLFEGIGAHTRQELENKLRLYLGEGNPFENKQE